ncbi:MAG: sodium-dependent transporter [Balneolales bacterium]|nr:sodium-dependent transporter [Balneolales bacterium]
MTKAKEAVLRFTSKWGLIISVLGIAVGTGNIWRFPRIAAQNGGEEGAGVFILAWVISLMLWSIPLIIAEYAIGRNGRRSVIGSFISLIGRKFAWLGGFVAFVATAIMFYYSVVAGWTIYYFIQSAMHPLPTSPEEADLMWNSFQSGILPVLFHALAIGLAGYVVLNGVKMIERVNLVLVPSLLIILLLAGVRALTLPGSMEGVRYLFTPEWGMLLNGRVWLEALTQNAWDTGAGWGLILTYGAYMRKSDRIVMSAFQTGIGNNLVSLWAAITIFATVFAILGASLSQAAIIDIMQNSGPASTGLTFIWMPQLFMQMAGGKMLAVLFFLALSFAAFSSLIAMIELATKVLIDCGWVRMRATSVVCLAGFLMGIPSAISLNIFANQDFVWGVGLMVSGLFVSVAVLIYGKDRFTAEILAAGEAVTGIHKLWKFLIAYVIPAEAVVLLGWWLYQSIFVFAPDSWFNPFDLYSFATFVFQAGLILGLLIVFNSRIADKMESE